MAKATFIAVLIGLLCASAVAQPEESARAVLAELYGAPPMLLNVTLSPDGSKVAALRPTAEGAVALVTRDVSSPEWSVVLARRPGAGQLQRCMWKTDAKILCAVSHSAGEGKVWLAVNLDGTGETRLDYVTDIVHLLPDQPGRAIAVSVYGSTGVLDIDTGSFTPFSSVDRTGLISDAQGRIRVRPYFQPNFEGWAFLPDPTGAWVILHDSLPRNDWFAPRGFADEVGEVLFVDSLAGYLTLFAWNGRGERRVVHAEPNAHVTNVSTIGKLARAGSAVVHDGTRRLEPIDPRVVSVRDAVARMHPSKLIDVLEEDRNQRYYLVFVGDRQRAGTYFRFDAREGRLDELASSHANVRDRVAAPRRTLEFSTEEGRRAVARVTVPPGATGALPAIVLPGDFDATSDALAPFLVASGFAVVEYAIEPLFAGETVGSNWYLAVSEIEGSLRALTLAGVVDSDRVCAVGVSLGAYVGIMTANERPDLFSCVVGIDATIDPVIGNSMVASLRYGAKVSVPVLLIGERSDRAAMRLQRALEEHAPTELVRYDSALSESMRDRVDLLARLGEFLAAHQR